jgi:hypothetical protein
VKLYVARTLIVLIVPLGMMACTDGEAPYPTTGPSYFDGAEADLPLTVEQLIERSDLIVTVRPTGVRTEVWNTLENFVSSRFQAEVLRVIKGEVSSGDRLQLYAPGGMVLETFPATGSRKPGTGTPAVREEFTDWPYFAKDRVELVFLKLVTPDDGKNQPFYYNLGPSARYNVVNGTLRSIYPTGIHVDDPGGVRTALHGASLDTIVQKAKN